MDFFFKFNANLLIYYKSNIKYCFGLVLRTGFPRCCGLWGGYSCTQLTAMRMNTAATHRARWLRSLVAACIMSATWSR